MTTDPFEALRRDVSYLGRILGDTLVEQEGAALLDLEERIRALAKARRSARRQRGSSTEIESLLAGLDTSTAERVARAFAHYFQLVNLAEQHHRRRRRRAYARANEPQPGSLAVALGEMSREPTRARFRALLERTQIELVFTAHPTEAQRHTVLDKHRQIAALLARRDRDDLTPAEGSAIDLALREQVAALWQTDEIRQERPRVGDEVKNTLFYLEEVLFPLVPGFYAEVEAVLAKAQASDEPVPSFLRFGSWVGADMDGNPNVTPEVCLDTALAQGARVLGLYLREIAALGTALSQSTRRVRISDELTRSIAGDLEALPALAAALRPATHGEPYRRKLRFIEARLEATRELLVRARREPAPIAVPAPASIDERARGYRSAEDFLNELRVLERSLAAHRGARAGLARVRGLIRQVEVFGFHLARLDVRVPAAWIRDAARAALWLEPGAPFEGAPLRRALGGPTPPPRPEAAGMRAMEALCAMRSRVSPHSGESFILSMARGRDDLLATLVIARIAGLYDPGAGRANVSVVPLFETLDDLDRAPSELDAALSDPDYGRYVSLRGGVQEIMIGYSDSNKDAGILAASFALYTAQRRLVAVAARHGVKLKIFHGRGGSIGRGGGPSQRAIEALPPGSIDGRFKLTEQGEVLGWKYLLPDIAERNLELTASGVLRASLQAPGPPEEELARYEAAFTEAAAASVSAYRALVRDPAFFAYYDGSTPLAEIAQMPLGSRPARRGAAGIEDLRAIPWVFAWTQSRQMVPGWFGAARGLRALIAKHGLALARAMRERWPFFATTLDAIAVSLATADMEIARRYAGLVEDRALGWRMFRTIALEHGRAVRAVCAILEQPTLLAHQPTLARSIELRNPYVDPLSFVQVELLRRKHALLRAGEPVPPELSRAILLTINGVAAGLRNTG